MLKLYTFTISHFSEKARWGLDFAGLDFTEKALLPGPHLVVTRRLAPRSEVPILVDDRRVVQGSGAILDYLAQERGAAVLAPPAGLADPLAAIERDADIAFGRGIQRIFYDVLLRHPALVVDL